jgi:hypothetical protein
MARKLYHRIPMEERGFLYSIREIRHYVCMSQRALYNYIHYLGCPVAKNPYGV